jgi:hypothetical protein
MYYSDYLKFQLFSTNHFSIHNSGLSLFHMLQYKDKSLVLILENKCFAIECCANSTSWNTFKDEFSSSYFNRFLEANLES